MSLGRKTLVLCVLGMVVLQAASFDVKGEEFNNFESKYATIYYQNSVSIEYAKEVALTFDNAYEVTGKLLNTYPSKKFKVYVFKNQDDLVNGLISIGGMSKTSAEFFRPEGMAPRPIDYILYVSPSWNGRSLYSSVAHEYTHTIVEELSCFGCQIYFKWFDEGLAELGGYNALRNSDMGANSWRNSKYTTVRNAVKKNNQFLLKDITTEQQWEKNIKQSQETLDLEYAESYVAIEYLESIYGISDLISILNFVKNGRNFESSFKKVTGITVDDFQKKLTNHLKKGILDNDRDYLMNFEEEKIKTNPNDPDTDKDSISDFGELKIGTDPISPDTDGDGLSDGEESGIMIDGLGEDWKSLNPNVRDPQNDTDFQYQGSDIESVYAVMDDKFLYLMIKINGKVNYEKRIEYCFGIDTNRDNKRDFQPGFDIFGQAWIWDLRGSKDYSDTKNVTQLGNFEIGAIDVIEFKIPLSIIENPKNITLEFYVYVDEKKSANEFVNPFRINKDKNNPPPHTDPLVPDITPAQKQIFDKAKSIFDQAMKAFNSLDYQKAKELFVQAKEKFQEINYQMKVKEAEEWIKKCTEEIERQKVIDQINTLLSQAKEEFQAQNFEKARELFEQIKVRYQELKDNENAEEIEKWIIKCDQELSKLTPSLIPQTQGEKQSGIGTFFSLFVILLALYLRKK